MSRAARRVVVLSLAVLSLSIATASATAQAPTASLWVDANGGDCDRSGVPAGYSDADACGTLDAAWDACAAGDLILVTPGAYAGQSITGDMAGDGCTIRGDAPETTSVAWLETAGDGLTLEDLAVERGTLHGPGWTNVADHVALENVPMHGAYVGVDIRGHDVTWRRSELGEAGVLAGERDFCGVDVEPVVIHHASQVVVEQVTFHPQRTISNASCNHMEMVRIDESTSDIAIRRSTFVPGDGSNTATIFITSTPSGDDPTDITIANNFFGGDTDASYTILSHQFVEPCAGFTIAYNTSLGGENGWQCTTTQDVLHVGNIGVKAGIGCYGTYVGNVWQHEFDRSNCGSDTWVSGPAYSTSELGIGPGGHLLDGSPGIDAAEADTGADYCTGGLGAVDRDGRPRPTGAACDAGAFESPRLFVTPTGTGVDCTYADPCGSLGDAYAAAAPGGTVEVEDGAYGAQAIEPVTGRTAPPVRIVPAPGASPSFTDIAISASHVHLAGAFEAPDVSIEGGAHVTLEGIDGDGLWLSDAEDVSVIDGDHGSVWFASDPMSSDITFDGVDIHGAGDETTACVYAPDVQRLTIRNSILRHCGEADLFITHWLGDEPTDLVLENNVFEAPVGPDPQNPSPYAIKVANFGDMQGFELRYNTLGGLIQIDPDVGSDVQLVGNVGVMGLFCPDNVEFSFNVWTSQACGLTDSVAADALDDFVDPAAHDWRPLGGSAVVDAGAPNDHPAADRAGVSRPQGTAPDAGAHELEQ